MIRTFARRGSDFYQGKEKLENVKVVEFASQRSTLESMVRALKINKNRFKATLGRICTRTNEKTLSEYGGFLHESDESNIQICSAKTGEDVTRRRNSGDNSSQRNHKNRIDDNRRQM
jgi:hypothetical protein